MIEIIHVGQFIPRNDIDDDNDESTKRPDMYGANAYWIKGKEDRDIAAEAKRIREINARSHAVVTSPFGLEKRLARGRFYTWSDFYDGIPTKIPRKDGNRIDDGETDPGMVNPLGTRISVSEKVRVVLDDETGFNQDLKVSNPEQARRDVTDEKIVALTEAIDEEALLRHYEQQYERWEDDEKERCSWQKIYDLLLENDGHYLRLASQLQENGVLFGLDASDTPLIADGGDDPIMKGISYSQIRKTVRSAGYEMFPHRGEQYQYPVQSHNDNGILVGREGWRKSLEIEKFEAFTGKPFIGKDNDKKWVEAWLESGAWEDGDTPYRNPATGKYKGSQVERTKEYNLPRCFVHNHHGNNLIVHEGPGALSPSRGVRRLLRLKK